MSTDLQNIEEICNKTQFARQIERICGEFHTKNSLSESSEFLFLFAYCHSRGQIHKARPVVALNDGIA